ncbi:hypothetical protein [Persicobacter psychrovividus]|uniref:Uncharacterized protein n=1 Tax=Persicobacter psychrovividus TaxID=387638 RepID=A0ABM7VLT5_9BACT|nr:hypothetical protein PEPS_42470 [Persicobacter psychrovividus]
MKKRLFNIVLVAAIFGGITACNKAEQATPVAQKGIHKVTKMPQHPKPYHMINWKEKAQDFDKYVYDWHAKGPFKPFIWKDTSHRNMDQDTYGLYTVVGDVRQGGNKNGGEFHESLCSLGSLLGAGLVGIDKTHQDGNNYVKMVQNYFNSDNGWNIMMNNTSPKIAQLGGGYGRDWWYDVFPNVLYYAVADVFPGVNHQDQLLHTIANQFYKADSVLNGDYDYSYFDYSKMKGFKTHIPHQQDAAAGHAYVLLNAYHKFGSKKYLKGAESALQALLAQKESRFYEVLMPFGALVAARLNAEEGTNYDYQHILDWTFDGCKAKDGRTGWGIVNEKWGKFDVAGLQGSLTDGGGYMFLMNTIDMAWPLVPMVRYDTRYANTIGKYMLNATNAARLFYPYEMPDSNQWLPKRKEISNNVIAYEGIKKHDMYNKKSLKGVTPVALGDGPNWQLNQPEISMFSIYGSAHAGIYGAIIEQTDVPEILKLNCLATDFYRNDAFPTYLVYNPYQQSKTITYNAKSEGAIDLYDAVNHTLVAENINGKGKVALPAQASRVLVEIPHGQKITKQGKHYVAGKTVVAFM